MKNFVGKLAVITGGGTGMGRALAEQLTAEGCHAAMCDVDLDNLTESEQRCAAGAPAGVRITLHRCDVSDEQQVIAFRDAVRAQHRTEHINLLFNNAGIGGGGSFVLEDRKDWDRTFAVCWSGVYYGSRAFLPLLIASDEGYIVNTSSVNGFWACLGPGIAHTAYSAAKFAVKGFTEALMVDLRLNAPHVKAAVVMPGHIGTSIMINSSKVLGKPDALHMRNEDVAALRAQLTRRGVPVEQMTDDGIRAIVHQLTLNFRDNAPMTSEAAATVILDGVRNDEWRILVGDDAQALDRLVRQSPLTAYEMSFIEALQAEGHMRFSL